jgi:hypothetical protein
MSPSTAFRRSSKLADGTGARRQRAEIERPHALAAQALRDVALDDALGEALDDGGLADARSSRDQDRVVLRAARGTPGSRGAPRRVAADHGVRLAGLRSIGQVATVLGEERRKRSLGIGRRN